MTCKKAIGVAHDMKELFGEKLELQIYPVDSEEAQRYNFKSSTNVLFDQQIVPLDVSTDRRKMQDFLSEKLAE